MSIFALDERTGRILLAVVLAIPVVVVHGAEHIGFLGQAGTLVLHGTCVVQSLNGMVCILEVVAMSTLVTHAPENDGWVVLLNLNIADIALHNSLAEVGVLCQTGAVVTHAMTLEVGLGTYIDAIFVAEVVEIWIARIMAGTDSIDIQLLHGADILKHTFAADNVATVWVHFVAVGTLDENGLTIEKDLTTLNLNMAETYLLANAFYSAIGIGKGYVQSVQIGGFCCPGTNVGDVGCKSSLGTRQFLCLLPHYAALVVIQGGLYLLALGICCIKVYGEFTSSETFIQILADVQVLNMSLGACIEINLASYTGEAPEVLVLAIRTVAPAHHLHTDKILLAWLQVFGDIKLGSILGVLAVAHLLAIYPKGEVTGSGTYIHDDVLAFPFGRHNNFLAIGAGVIVLLLDIGRIGRELGGPCITYILIDNVAIAIQLKEAGHGECGPVLVVISREMKTFGCIVVMAGKVEVPQPLQRHITTAKRLIALCCKVFGLESEERGMGCQRVDTCHIGIHPRFLAVVLGGNTAT